MVTVSFPGLVPVDTAIRFAIGLRRRGYSAYVEAAAAGDLVVTDAERGALIAVSDTLAGVDFDFRQGRPGDPVALSDLPVLLSASSRWPLASV